LIHFTLWIRLLELRFSYARIIESCQKSDNKSGASATSVPQLQKGLPQMRRFQA
jgi:hypothetical protein